MMNNENGRSMVEMLGVLAIIGVLSVAGIAGYTMAMKKYRSNEILNVASQLVILAKTANGGTGITAATDNEGLGVADSALPAGVTEMSVGTGETPAVTVKGAGLATDGSACKLAADNVGTTYTITCANP